MTTESTLSSWLRAALVARAGFHLTANVLGNTERLVSDLLDDSASLARDAAALAPLLHRSAVDVQRVAVAMPRLTRILRDAGMVLLSLRFARMRAQTMRPGEARAMMEAVHERSAERLYTLCAELGAGLVKLGQLASTRADILPAPYVRELSRLQDAAPPVPFEEIAARVEAELGAPLADLFEAFEEEPLATASLAQVHGALLPGGREVVVKVQIPGVEERVLTDLLAIRVLARWASDLFPGVDLATVADELARSVVAELDYVSEADAAEAFGARFAADPRVVVPDVVRSHTTARVLTLERLHGARLGDRLAAAEAEGRSGEVAIDGILGALIDFYGVSILRHGVFHSDPHPGNFLVLPGERLGVLDFGSVTEQAPTARSGYGRIVASMMQADPRGLARELSALGFGSRDGDVAALEAFAAELLAVVATDLMGSLAELDPAEQLEKTLRLAQSSPINRIPADFVMVGRVLVALSGFVLRYRPRLSLPALLLPYLAEALEST